MREGSNVTWEVIRLIIIIHHPQRILYGSRYTKGKLQAKTNHFLYSVEKYIIAKENVLWLKRTS
jgi:hypothetical protein